MSLISSASATGGGSLTTSAINTSGATLLVAWIVYLYDIPGSGAIPAVTDSKSNSWSNLTQNISNAFSLAGTLVYSVNPTVGSGHTFSCSRTSLVLNVAAFSLIATTSPFDAESNQIGGTGATTIAPGPLVTTVNNELVVTGIGWEQYLGDGGTGTIDDSFSVINSDGYVGGANYGSAFGYRIVTGSGTSANPTWDTGTIGRRAANIASFLPGVASAIQPSVFVIT